MYSESTNCIYQWGLDIIHFLQQFDSPIIVAVMKFFTFLGEPLFYCAVLPIIFWCIDERRGFKLGWLFLLSCSVNVVIKNSLQIMRPFKIDPSVALISASGYSTPSGHSQASATFWPIVAHNFTPQKFSKSKAFTVVKYSLAVLLPISIGISRIYLGVHYPTDVFLGWAIGIIFILSSFFLYGKASAVILKIPVSFRILCAAIPAFLLLAINKSNTTLVGIYFGLSVGYAYLYNQGNFEAKYGSFFKKILRVLVGVLGICVIFFFFWLFMPEAINNQYYPLLNFIRFTILGVWVSYGAPKIFIKLKLATEGDTK